MVVISKRAVSDGLGSGPVSISFPTSLHSLSSTMKHGLSWQTASLLHLIGSEGERIVKIANTKLTSSNVP